MILSERSLTSAASTLLDGWVHNIPAALCDKPTAKAGRTSIWLPIL